MSTIIESIGSENLTEIKRISDSCFGLNYLTEKDLDETIQQKGVFLKIIHDSVTIGFCISFHVENSYEHHSIFGGPIPNFLSIPYSVIKTIAILPDFQNKGFGFQMLENIICKLKNGYDSHHFIYPAWTESDSFGFTRKISKLGFKSVQTIPNFWYSDSLTKDYQCIKCGTPPCHCSLTVFLLNF